VDDRKSIAREVLCWKIMVVCSSDPDVQGLSKNPKQMEKNVNQNIKQPVSAAFSS